MGAKKNKYYVVWKGHRTGVFETWEDCKAQLKGFTGVQFKSFLTFDDAKEAYKKGYDHYLETEKLKNDLTEIQRKKIGQPNYNSIAVDAASSGNPGIMEYRGVDTKTKKELFKQGPFKKGTNNIGEFLAIVHGLAFLKQENSSRIIYTDSKTAISWVKKKICNTKLQRTNTNEKLFQLIDRAIKWLKSNSYSTTIVKWETKVWGEIPADFGRK